MSLLAWESQAACLLLLQPASPSCKALPSVFLAWGVSGQPPRKGFCSQDKEEEGTGLGTAVNQIWSCCLSGSLLLLPQPKLQLSKDISLIFISQKQRGCFGIAVEHCTHIVWYSPRKRGCRTGAGTDFPRHTMVLLSPRSPQLLQSHPIPSQGP